MPGSVLSILHMLCNRALYNMVEDILSALYIVRPKTSHCLKVTEAVEAVLGSQSALAPAGSSSGSPLLR